jgi:hypothetical protein
VPRELLADTVLELRSRFHALSCETQIIRGVWEHEGKEYTDELGRLFVDVPDLPENCQFFVEYKQKLKDRFQQLDIWLTSYPVEVI